MRPIDADAIEYYKGEYPPTPCVSKKYIDSLPTIEPKPGKWLDFGWPHCSECGYEQRRRTNYCPNCGARMDGKEQKGEIK